MLPREVRGVFQNAIERLFYSDRLKIGEAVLPRSKIRSHLWQTDGMVLQDAYAKLKANTERTIKNSTAYVMTVLRGSIWEVHSDLLVDRISTGWSSGRPGLARRGCSIMLNAWQSYLMQVMDQLRYLRRGQLFCFSILRFDSSAEQFDRDVRQICHLNRLMDKDGYLSQPGRRRDEM